MTVPFHNQIILMDYSLMTEAQTKRWQLDGLIAELEEPRLGIHEDGTEELKTWEQLYEQCARAAAWLKEHSRCEADRSPFVADMNLSEAELISIKPGPIQVVYPLDEEWNAALEEAALYMQEQDCAHKCGVGAEIAEKIRSRKRPLRGTSNRSEKP